MKRNRTIMLIAMAVIGAAGSAGGGAMASNSEGQAAAASSFAVIYRAGPKWKPGEPMEKQELREHFFFMRGLHREGRLVLAGPMGPDGGLVLLWAHDRADADRTVAQDPAVRAGVFTAAVSSFTPRFVGEKGLTVAVP